MEQRLLFYHLKHCPDCRVRLEALQRTACLLEAEPKVPAPAGLDQRILAAAKCQVPARHRSSSGPTWKRNLALAGAILVIAVNLLILLKPTGPLVFTADQSAVVRTSGSQVTVPAGVEINGDLVVVGGKLVIAGAVRGDVRVVRGEVELAPTAQVGGQVTVSRSTLAFIGSNINAGWQELKYLFASWWSAIHGGW